MANKTFPGLEEFLGNEMNIEDEDRMFQEFVQSLNERKKELNDNDVDDLIELSAFAGSEGEALKFINKALRMEPNNIRAKIQKAEIKTNSEEEFLKKIEKILREAEEHLICENIYCEETIGEFWSIPEVRPYLMALGLYLEILTGLGMYKKAVDTSEKMLTLCKNDELEVRYKLMTLYAYFEDCEKGEELYKKFSKYGETQIMLPLSLLYYKQGEFAKSKRILTRLEKTNKDTKKFFEEVIKSGVTPDVFEHFLGVYKQNTIEEYSFAYCEGLFLYFNADMYFKWAYEELNKKKK